MIKYSALIVLQSADISHWLIDMEPSARGAKTLEAPHGILRIPIASLSAFDLT